MLESFTTPRPYLLQRASTPGKPLVIFLGGWTWRISADLSPKWYEGLFGSQFGLNAVVESGLIKTALDHDISVCWVSSSRYAWAP